MRRAGYIYTATQDTLADWAGNPLSHYERMHKPDAPFTRASFNPEGAGSVMATMLKEAGVTALYGTSFVDAIVGGAASAMAISAIVVENASGRQAITGKIFIEGSGTAQLAAARRRAVSAWRRPAAENRRLGWHGAPYSGWPSLDHERHRLPQNRRAIKIRQRSTAIQADRRSGRRG